MIVRKRSWPAVSQIWSLTRLPSNSIVRILKSIPMVVIKDGVNESSLKRNRQQDLPTPESPISRSLIWGAGQPHVNTMSCLPFIMIRTAEGESRMFEGTGFEESEGI